MLDDPVFGLIEVTLFCIDAYGGALVMLGASHADAFVANVAKVFFANEVQYTGLMKYCEKTVIYDI